MVAKNVDEIADIVGKEAVSEEPDGRIAGPFEPLCHTEKVLLEIAVVDLFFQTEVVEQNEVGLLCAGQLLSTKTLCTQKPINKKIF